MKIRMRLQRRKGRINEGGSRKQRKQSPRYWILYRVAMSIRFTRVPHGAKQSEKKHEKAEGVMIKTEYLTGPIHIHVRDRTNTYVAIGY